MVDNIIRIALSLTLPESDVHVDAMQMAMGPCCYQLCHGSGDFVVTLPWVTLGS